MILTIGFVPDDIAGAMVKSIGGEVVRSWNKLSDIQFKNHYVKISKRGDITVYNNDTRKHFILYWNEHGSVHVCDFSEKIEV